MRSFQTLLLVALFALGFGGALVHEWPGAASANRLAQRSQNVSQAAQKTSDEKARFDSAPAALARAAAPATTPTLRSSPESLPSPIAVPPEDADVRERILAVSELSRRAVQGDDVNAIRESLRLAAADESEEVAERAKEAYDKLISDEDSPPEASQSNP